jgi:hypothetical protein
MEKCRKEAMDDLGIEIGFVDSNSHGKLFDAKKKAADEAFRKFKEKKYKTINI